MKEGWEIKKLKDVCSYDKEIVTNPDLPYVGLEHIESKSGKFVGTLKPTTVKSSTFHFTEKHVLYGRLRPYLNKVFLPFFEGHCSTEIFPISVTTRILREYLYYWFLLDSTVKKIDATRTGARMPRANMTQVSEFEIPIPPLSEQKEIVALLDDVLSRIDKARVNIEKNIENAEEIYQKRLENVFHGALTSNGSPDSVDELLAEIQKERETLIKAGKMKKEKPLPPISDDEIPYSIPYTWKWVKMASISTKITDGEHKTPKRVDKYQGYYLLSARNVCNGYLQLDDVDYVDEDEYNNISRRCNPQYGDVLLSCSGSVGRCAIVPDDNHYVMVRSAAMISPLCVDSKFLMYTIQSPALQTQIKNSSKQTAQANLFQEPIRNLLVPLPPLSEQKKIASHLDELRKQTDALKARYTAKLQALDELKQSLLEKAFRGELT